MIKHIFLFTLLLSLAIISCAPKQQDKTAASIRMHKNLLAAWLENPVRVLSNNIDAFGVSSIELENEQHQVLRFKMYRYKIAALHHDIAFQLFTYRNDFLQKIETFDRSGKNAGEHESFGEAITIFTVEKPELYIQKKKLIDKAEGNIDLKDENEKIIRVQCYDANSKEIIIPQSSYISSSDYEKYCSRMYWP